MEYTLNFLYRDLTMLGKNPKHARRQGYTPSGGKPYGYSAGSKKTGSNGKTNYSGTTPKTSALPNGDRDATMGFLYKNN